MKRLFGVDGAADKLWLDRCAAVFPAFSKYDAADMQRNNNTLESYHNWLKNKFFT
jgi:hypothetical protein